MNTIIKRIILTVIGVPLMLSIIFFLHYQHYLAFMIVAVVFTILGSYELKTIFVSAMPTSHVGGKTILPPWISVLLPVSVHLQLFYVNTELPLLTITILGLVLISCIIEMLTGQKDNFKGSASRLGSQLACLFYPAALVVFLIRITAYKNAGWLLVLYFLLVFSNDVFAYLFGMIFGNSSRNIFKASPKKSLAGFIGGTIMAIVNGYIYILLIPEQLSFSNFFIPGILFLIISIAANTGDLIESVLKRSANIKDSGSLMPGRGGILDSMDSIVFGAPFFYIFILFIQ